MREKNEKRLPTVGNEWIRLKKSYLQKNLHDDINEYIKWLQYLGVVEVSHSFNRNKYSKAYRFTSSLWDSGMSLYRVTDWTTYKRTVKHDSIDTIDQPSTSTFPFRHITPEQVERAYTACGFQPIPYWQLNSSDDWYSNGDSCLAGSACVCQPSFNAGSSFHPESVPSGPTLSSSPGSESLMPSSLSVRLPLSGLVPSGSVSSLSSVSPSLRSGGVVSSSLYNATRFCTYPTVRETEKHLEKSLLSVTIKSGWKEYIEEQRLSGNWMRHQADEALWSVQAIEDGRFRFRRSDKVQRLHTNITNLKSDLRQFLILDGCKDLTEIDIRASQPYLLTGLMRWATRCRYECAPTEEVIDQWAEIVAGEMDFYQLFIDKVAEMSGKVVSRDEAKEGMLTLLFSRNEQKSIFKNTFAQSFPEVDLLIRKLKESEGLGSHRDCATLLQQYEAAIMIERVGSRLAAERIPVVTIHDSVIVKTIDALRTEQIMCDELTRTVGTQPVLRKQAHRDQSKHPLSVYPPRRPVV